MDLFMSPEVKDNLDCKKNGHHEEFNVTKGYRNVGIEEINNTNYHCTAFNVDRLRIGNDEVLQKTSVGIQDPDSNFKGPGKWLATNKSLPMSRWYSASESGRQHTFSRKRSVSSTSVTPRRNKPQEESTNKEYIRGFQRSLKLLGVQPKDFGINNKVYTSNSHISSLRVGPTFCTRLTNRSFSLENLRSAIQDHIGDCHRASGDHLDRKTLSSAVYEEWYFQKLEEARRIKKAQEVNEQKKKEHYEKVKTEQKQKVQENFSKWKELKNKQKQQWKQKQQQKEKLEIEAAGDFRVMNGTTRVKPNQEESFLLWKREKDKLLRQKKLEQKIQKEAAMKPDNEKKVSAEIVFKSWKKRADVTLKEKAQEKERKKQEDEQAKREQEQEKRESAKASFHAWKIQKDAELKKKIKEARLAEEQKRNTKLMREAERLYEAEQAFEEWLDQMEERRNRQIDAVHKRKQKIQHQFPWSPGGSVHW